jgi:hypothetical protein
VRAGCLALCRRRFDHAQKPCICAVSVFLRDACLHLLPRHGVFHGHRQAVRFQDAPVRKIHMIYDACYNVALFQTISPAAYCCIAFVFYHKKARRLAGRIAFFSMSDTLRTACSVCPYGDLLRCVLRTASPRNQAFSVASFTA